MLLSVDVSNSVVHSYLFHIKKYLELLTRTLEFNVWSDLVKLCDKVFARLYEFSSLNLIDW